MHQFLPSEEFNLLLWLNRGTAWGQGDTKFDVKHYRRYELSWLWWKFEWLREISFEKSHKLHSKDLNKGDIGSTILAILIGAIYGTLLAAFGLYIINIVFGGN